MIMGLINYPELGETAERIEEEMEYYARLVLSLRLSTCDPSLSPWVC